MPMRMPKLKYQPLALATERNGTSSDRHFSPAPGMTTASFVAACDGGGGGSEIGTLGLSHSPHPLPMLPCQQQFCLQRQNSRRAFVSSFSAALLLHFHQRGKTDFDAFLRPSAFNPEGGKVRCCLNVYIFLANVHVQSK